MPYHIAIATKTEHATAGGFWLDDAWLKSELERRGHQVDIIDWHDDTIELTDYHAIFVSSTWDIPDHPAAFEGWLDRCEADGNIRLINASHMLRRGIRKYDYLGDLIEWFGEVISKGGSVVPTRFYVTQASQHQVRNLEVITGKTFADLLVELDRDPLWSGKSIVVKPVTSADGKNTFLYDRTTTGRILTYYPHDVLRHLEEAQAKFAAILNNPTSNGVILQPYMDGVTEGEYSLTFFGLTLSHAVQKPPGFKADRSLDRRYIERDHLPQGMVDFARQVILEFERRYGASSLTRTRVDLFVGTSNDSDRCPIVSEVEFVELNTNIRIVNRDKGESEREKVVGLFADAIEQRIDELSSASTRLGNE
jgi:hypothetical protein